MQQLLNYLKYTKYHILDASNINIFETQEKLRECRINPNLIVFVEKNKISTPFFESLKRVGMDKQNSNYTLSSRRDLLTCSV